MGIGEIDKQHKMFFVVINRLDDIVKAGAKREEVVRVLADLSSYSNYHFGEEEKHFKQIDYKRSKEHMAQHEGFCKKLEDFIRRLETDDPNLAVGIAEFARGWLRNHLMKEDRKFAEAYNKHRQQVKQRVKQ